MLQSLQNILGF